MPDDGGLTGDTGSRPELKIGYARVSTDAQDLTVQREALGVDIARIYTDHGLSGTNRAPQGDGVLSPVPVQLASALSGGPRWTPLSRTGGHQG